MKLGTVVLLSVLVAAPACGGGGGSNSPTAPTLAATFTPDQPTPGPKTAAMAQGPKANDIVTVDVTLTGASNAYGTTFEVVYDSTHTDYVGFTTGTAFEQGATNPIQYQAAPPSTPGRAIITVTRTGADAPANISGTMTVIRLQFRVKTAGTWPLYVNDPPGSAVVFDAQAPPQVIPGVNWYAGSVVGS